MHHLKRRRGLWGWGLGGLVPIKKLTIKSLGNDSFTPIIKGLLDIAKLFQRSFYLALNWTKAEHDYSGTF